MSMESQFVEAIYTHGVLQPREPLLLQEQSVVWIDVRPTPTPPVSHPYVTSTPDIQGGQPVIRGTRVTVKAVVGYYKMGLSVEEILGGFSELAPAQVYDALSYYHDHQEAIEAALAADDLPALMDKFELTIDEKGFLHPAKETP